MNGRLAVIIFFAAFFYSLLMFKEFFVNDWIRKQFSVYIASHEILVFPLFFYLFALNGMLPEHFGKAYFWFLSIFLGSQLFLLEVARKVRPKELEVGSRDTYSAQYGILGASALLVFLGVMIAGLDFYIGKTIYGKVSMSQLLPLLMGLFFIYSVICFSRWPSAKSAKGAFNTAILFLLITDVTLVAQFFIR
jgi:nitric oxide reductase large subunit